MQANCEWTFANVQAVASPQVCHALHGRLLLRHWTERDAAPPFSAGLHVKSPWLHVCSITFANIIVSMIGMFDKRHKAELPYVFANALHPVAGLCLQTYQVAFANTQRCNSRLPQLTFANVQASSRAIMFANINQRPNVHLQVCKRTPKQTCKRAFTNVMCTFANMQDSQTSNNRSQRRPQSKHRL